MAINFDSFTEGTTSNIQSNDYVVGFGDTNPNGERKWTISTIANAVSGITNLLTPANFTGANQSLTASGFQKLPGGLIIQWGITGLLDAGTSVTMTFAIAYPNSLLGIAIANAYASAAATVDYSAGVDANEVGMDPKAQFKIRNRGIVSQNGINYISIGY